MPDLTALIGPLVFALLLVVLLAFALGTQRNIRAGNARLEWLQQALPALGRRTTLRWLGSSAVQLDLVEPAEPFRELRILVVLEPRDVPLLWLLTRATGRRDVLIFRASLRRAPRLELDATAPAAWIKPADADEAREWPLVAFPGDVPATAAPGADPGDLAAARQAWERLAGASAEIWRLSIRRTVPHLEIHVRPARAETTRPERLVEPLRDLAAELARH